MRTCFLSERIDLDQALDKSENSEKLSFRSLDPMIVERIRSRLRILLTLSHAQISDIVVVNTLDHCIRSVLIVVLPDEVFGLNRMFYS
jgi:hypothetical protein